MPHPVHPIEERCPKKNTVLCYSVTVVRKGKEEYLYSAILADTPLTKRSDMDHTVLPANYTMSAFPS